MQRASRTSVTSGAASAKRPTTEQSGANCQAPSSRVSFNISVQSKVGAPCLCLLVVWSQRPRGAPWLQPTCDKARQHL
jgi:hypothetical protein